MLPSHISAASHFRFPSVQLPANAPEGSRNGSPAPCALPVRCHHSSSCYWLMKSKHSAADRGKPYPKVLEFSNFNSPGTTEAFCLLVCLFSRHHSWSLSPGPGRGPALSRAVKAQVRTPASCLCSIHVRDPRSP